MSDNKNLPQCPLCKEEMKKGEIISRTSVCTMYQVICEEHGNIDYIDHIQRFYCE